MPLRIKMLVEHFSSGNNSAFARMMGIPEKNIRNYIDGVQPKASFLRYIRITQAENAEVLLNHSFFRGESGGGLVAN